MVIRALTIDGHAKAKVEHAISFASKNENWYRPFATADSAPPIPGDDKRYVTQLDSFRCVFTLTVDGDGMLWRDLSISVPSKDYPHPSAAFAIADMFGFRGCSAEIYPIPDDMVFEVKEDEHCVRLCQPYDRKV